MSVLADKDLPGNVADGRLEPLVELQLLPPPFAIALVPKCATIVAVRAL